MGEGVLGDRLKDRIGVKSWLVEVGGGREQG